MSAPSQLATERRAVLWTLLALAAAGWAVVGWQAAGMGDMEHGGLDLTMGMAAPLFVAMWLAMMAAMMLPASAPMIIAFDLSQRRKRQRGAPHVPTWLFVAPYLALWVLFGAVAYGVALLVDDAAEGSMWAMENAPRIAGGLLVLAGVYQLTPLKRVCLSRCRSPLSFMLSYWRGGRWGAVGMGMRHGLFCLGCCWLLFVVLIPLGIMNVAAMAVVAALVFAEKALPGGDRVATLAAPVLIAYGTLAVLVPEALPTTVA